MFHAGMSRCLVVFLSVAWLAWQFYGTLSGDWLTAGGGLVEPAARLITLVFAAALLVGVNKSSLEAGGAFQDSWGQFGVGIIALSVIVLVVTVFHPATTIEIWPDLLPALGVVSVLALTFIYISRHAVYVAVCIVGLSVVGVSNAFKGELDFIFLLSVVGNIWTSADGVFGDAIAIASSYLFPFILLGASLQALKFDRYILALIEKFKTTDVRHDQNGWQIISVGTASNTSSETLSKLKNETTPSDQTVTSAAGHSSLIAFAQLAPPVLPAAALLMYYHLGLELTQVFWIFGILSICVLTYFKVFTQIEVSSPVQRQVSLAYAIGSAIILMLGLAVIFLGMDALVGAGIGSWQILIAGLVVSSLLLIRFSRLSIRPDLSRSEQKWQADAHHRIIPVFTFIGLIVANDLELGLIAFLGAAHSIILLVLENVLSNAERTLSYRSPAESFQEISQVVLSPVVKAAIFASRLTIALTLVGITCAPFLIYGFGPDITEFISAITFNNLVLVVAFSVVVALVVGLSLPTTATYFTTILIMGPIVAAVGEANGIVVSLVNLYAAVILFACLADVTPPDDIASETISNLYGVDKWLVYQKLLKLLMPVIAFSVSIAFLPMDLSEIHSAAGLIVNVFLLLTGMVAIGEALLAANMLFYLRAGLIFAGAALMLPQYQLDDVNTYQETMTMSEWTSISDQEVNVLAVKGIFIAADGEQLSEGVGFQFVQGENLETYLYENGAKVIRADGDELYITFVTPLSPAAEAGLEVSMRLDRIIVSNALIDKWIYYAFFLTMLCLISYVHAFRERRE
jgi:TRAP-type uncharacterized transport system fused permease subunit